MSQRYIGGLIYNPPGGFSGYLDGSGDYLTFPNNASMPFGTGSFTIEFWINGPLNNDKFIIGGRAAIGGSLHITTGGFSSTAGALRYVGSSTITSGSVLITDGTWHHVAIVRNGSSNITLYIDGASVGTGTDTTNYTGTTGTWVIGANDFNFPSNVGSNQLNAYLSNLRIVKSAVYTAAFDPPNGPLQAITNTQLLTCAYSTFRDGSTNNSTITANGSTAVSTQNPFPLTALPNPALGNQGNGVYSMSQYQALRSQNLWPAADPYFDLVTLMLHGNGTNGAQNNTFLDSSTNNFTITRNGNTTQGTFTPYGSNWSNFFDGSGDQLNLSASAISGVGSSNFSIECWVFASRQTNTFAQGLVSYGIAGNTSGTSYLSFQLSAAGNLAVAYAVGSSLTLSDPALFPINQWAHAVVCRSGSTLSMFVNGNRVATASTSATVGSGGDTLTIGGQWFANSADRQLQGYLSNVRIVNGASAYDATQATITVPTSPLTAITNTSLLTCQSNRFIDNSSNNFTITRNGDVSVQRFSPFNPTTPYAAGTIGGSGYFDGSGDYLSVASSSTLAFGTGDFTIEGWYYPLAYSGDVNTITSTTTADSASVSAVNINVPTDGSMQIGNLYSTGAGTVPLRAWTYFVVSRVSGTIRLFINGVEKSSASNTTNYTSTGCLIGARFAGGQYYITAASYISGLKFTVGSGVTSVTVPSAPPTGGNVLTNFTNAGIIDNAMMNDLETVGNAQISTSVSKFGGGSLAFDGSGDYLLIPNGENFNFGSGSWTIEFWVRFNTVGVRQVILSSGNGSGTNAPFFFELNNSLRLRFLIQTAATGQIFVDTTYTPNANQWYHLAGVRNGSTATFYVDGVSVGSVSPGTNALTAITNQIVIGDYIGLGIPLNGYLDDVRFTKGYARYTANFTPQRSQWQDQ